MTTIVDQTFRINGVIDTGKTVMQNMQTLANAVGSWVTYDINTGRWAVVINKPELAVKSFDDSNIIGSITVSGTGLNEFYNKVQFDFPHKDILDQKDTITYEIPLGQRFQNEFDNVLNFSIDCVNDPIQAELLAVQELKQSRVDKIIQFRTDFTSLGLNAGEVIEVTSAMYGFTAKKFRIVQIEEEDADDNTIQLAITALEYDADIYDTSGLLREARTIENGIISKISNTTTITRDNTATSATVNRSLTDTNNTVATTALTNTLIGTIETNLGSGGGNLASVQTATIAYDTATILNVYTTAKNDWSANYYADIVLNIGSEIETLIWNIQVPQGIIEYTRYQDAVIQPGPTISAVETTGVQSYAYFPTDFWFFYETAVLDVIRADTHSQTIQFVLKNAPAGNYVVRIQPTFTFDLNTNNPGATAPSDPSSGNIIYPTDYDIFDQANGAGITINLIGFFKNE